MPPKTQENVLERLEKPVHTSMVHSGDWDRISRRLKRKLDESGWTDEIGSKAREECRRTPNLSIRALENNITAQAYASIPPEVKEEIMDEIRQIVEEHLKT